MGQYPRQLAGLRRQHRNASPLRNETGRTRGASAALSNYATKKTGWVAGGGIEWMLDANWMVRGEYLHADLGNVTNLLVLDPVNSCFAGGPCGATFSRDVRYDIVRLGASYKFGGPVVARY